MGVIKQTVGRTYVGKYSISQHRSNGWF